MEFLRIVRNKKFVLAVLAVILLQLLLSFYFEYQNLGDINEFRAARANCNLSSEEDIYKNYNTYSVIKELLYFDLYIAEAEDSDELEMLQRQREEIVKNNPEAAAYYEENIDEIQNNIDVIYNIEYIYATAVEKLEYIAGYGDYVTGLLDKSGILGAISIFTDDFSGKSIEKFAADWAQETNAELVYTNTTAFERTVQSYTANLFLIFLCLITCIFMFYNKNKTLDITIRSCRQGRETLALNKLKAAIPLMFIYTVVISAANFILYSYIYGFDLDWGANAKSSAIFQDFNANISFAKVFILFILIKAVTLILVFCVFAAIILLTSEINIFILASAVLTAAEAVVYSVVPKYSYLSLFRVANIFTFLNFNEWITYTNINIFNSPVKIEAAAGCSLIILTVISGAVLIAAEKKRYPIKTKNKAEIFLYKFLSKIKENFNALKGKIFYKGFEWYKLFVLKHTGLVVLLLCIVFVNLYSFGGFEKTPLQTYMSNYYSAYSGEVSQELIDALEEEITGTSNINETVYKAVTNLQAQIEYINDEIAAGHNAYFINTDGYENLIGSNSQTIDTMYIIGMLFILLFMAYGVISADENETVNHMLRCTKNGRKQLFYSKIKTSYFSLIILYAVTTAFNVVYYKHYFGLETITAPIQSIETFSRFQLNISILTYMILLYVSRLIIFMAIESIMISLGVFIKSKVALILNFIIFIVPCLLSFLGIESLQEISFSNLLCFAQNYQSHSNFTYIYGAVTALLAIAGAVLLLNAESYYEKTKAD